MPRRIFLLVAAAVFGFVATVAAQDKKDGDELTVSTAQGVVDKADKDSLTVKPRGPGGQFQKTIVLRVTGTSKLSLLSPQKRDKKTVITQRDVDAKDLTPGQPVAVIYAAAGKDGPVLLSAVVQPAAGK